MRNHIRPDFMLLADIENPRNNYLFLKLILKVMTELMLLLLKEIFHFQEIYCLLSKVTP